MNTIMVEGYLRQHREGASGPAGRGSGDDLRPLDISRRKHGGILLGDVTAAPVAGSAGSEWQSDDRGGEEETAVLSRSAAGCAAAAPLAALEKEKQQPTSKKRIRSVRAALTDMGAPDALWPRSERQ